MFERLIKNKVIHTTLGS